MLISDIPVEISIEEKDSTVSPSQQATVPHSFHPFGHKQTGRGTNAGRRSIEPQVLHLNNAATQSKGQLAKEIKR